jgi:high-affinity iron transporter
MVGAFIIAFREVIEAGLIVGIVLAATRGIAGRARWILLGAAAGILGAALVALFARAIANAFEGGGQELLNGAVLLVAVVMLVWHNVWMASHGRELAGELRAAGEAVRTGNRTAAALAVVVGAAMLREGSELVLFLYGLVASGTSGFELEVGALAGIAAGAAMSAVSYFGIVALPARYVFSVTTGLIVFLAAGMAAQGVQFLSDANLITVLDHRLWDTSAYLSEGSMPGRVLHALVGYTARPTELQALAYVATIVVMLVLMRVAAPAPRPRPQTA